MSVFMAKASKKQIPLLFNILHTKTKDNSSTTLDLIRANSAIGTQLSLMNLCKNGQLNKALHILQVMDKPLNSSTYVSFLQACLNNKTQSKGKLVHAHIIQTGFDPDFYLDNMLVIMYSKCGNLVNARKVFDEMPQRNVVSWTAMISSYACHGFRQAALELFQHMKRTGVQPNQFTYSTVLPICANLMVLEKGKEIHADMLKAGFECDVFAATALLDMYIKCRQFENAQQVFDEMPQRSVVSWTAMVAGYARSGLVDKALETFEMMPERNAVSWTAVIAGCWHNGHVHEAIKLFWKIPERHTISWNAMISGYTQHRFFAEALELFRQMQLMGTKPNLITLTSVLPACTKLVTLEQGKGVHEDIIRKGFQSDVFLDNALLDMYAKCGSIENARKVFDRMGERDVVSWSSLIAGYAMHGFTSDALQLFGQMQCSGIKPDHITFVGVLTACCHAGLVDDAWYYFTSMSNDHFIKPSLEHYSCMVNLLGRVGHLNKAVDILNMMPMKPDVVVWASLLGACRIHNNVEIAEYVAEHLFEMDPENADHYVLLSNIYATVGMWDGVKRVRRMMKERKVKKTTGLSWIAVNNKLNTFVVGDRLHPHS